MNSPLVTNRQPTLTVKNLLLSTKESAEKILSTRKEEEAVINAEGTSCHIAEECRR